MLQKEKGRKLSRIDQLVSWCGGETFDGCIVFDEVGGCDYSRACPWFVSGDILLKVD